VPLPHIHLTVSPTLIVTLAGENTSAPFGPTTTVVVAARAVPARTASTSAAGAAEGQLRIRRHAVMGPSWRIALRAR
jgi:hypothetical protein